VGTIVVADGVHREIDLLAVAWNTSESEVIRRLLDEYAKLAGRSGRRDDPDQNTVKIHSVYAGQRVEAIYHRDTKRVDVTSGVLTGQSYNRPSGAAIAVVQALKPGVNPSRNGWSFWVVTDTGKLLQSVR
jgi:hypothetical protein